jgi:4-phosphopantoate--beta-alanine ligase
MKIPKAHPRFISLRDREKIVHAAERGLVAIEGLIAQGRGEAFDYLIGEQTLPEAARAEEVAAATLLRASYPVISVNGNVVALVCDEIIALSKSINAPIEINLFYRTERRIQQIAKELRDHGAMHVLGEVPDAKLPNLDYVRALCTVEGIYNADVVLVPLEDGDRAHALRTLNKTVIAIDLNPLSRTAQCATITIVDNVVRAIPQITRYVQQLNDRSKDELEAIVNSFDNRANLRSIISYITRRFE